MQQSRWNVKLTRVLILELGDIVDILVNDDPWGVVLGVGGNIVLAEGLRHGDQGEGTDKDKAKVGIKMNFNRGGKKSWRGREDSWGRGS
jgi:hypothetical protein